MCVKLFSNFVSKYLFIHWTVSGMASKMWCYYCSVTVLRVFYHWFSHLFILLGICCLGTTFVHIWWQKWANSNRSLPRANCGLETELCRNTAAQSGSNLLQMGPAGSSKVSVNSAQQLVDIPVWTPLELLMSHSFDHFLKPFTIHLAQSWNVNVTRAFVIELKCYEEEYWWEERNSVWSFI